MPDQRTFPDAVQTDEHIAILREFFERRKFDLSSATCLVSLAERIGKPGPFGEELAALLRTIMYREALAISPEQLEELLILAAGGAAAQRRLLSSEQMGRISTFVRRSAAPLHKPLFKEVGVEDLAPSPLPVSAFVLPTPTASVPPFQLPPALAQRSPKLKRRGLEIAAVLAALFIGNSLPSILPLLRHKTVTSSKAAAVTEALPAHHGLQRTGKGASPSTKNPSSLGNIGGQMESGNVVPHLNPGTSGPSSVGISKASAQPAAGTSNPASVRPASFGGDGTKKAVQLYQIGPDGLFSLSSGAMAPNLLSAPLPVYPPGAIESHVQGRVTLKTIVGADGNVISARALNGPMVLRSAAEDAVLKWQFRPYLMNGSPTETVTTTSIDFRLDD